MNGAAQNDRRRSKSKPSRGALSAGADSLATVTKQSTATDRLLKIHALLDEVTSSPWSHDILELAMATALSLRISQQDETALVWLLIVGPPSSDKTFAVLLLKTAGDVYYLDTVTENFLGSGYRDEKGGRAPDLFKELNEKCVVIKELGTVFGLRPDKVKKFLGDLQAIYDREYHKATGTVGTIHGKAAFAIVACVTPATLHDHHEYMARIGPRFLMYRPPQLTGAEEDEGLGMLWDAEQSGKRKNVVADLRTLVAEHLRECSKRSLESQPETPEQQECIDRLAKFVARGRTVIRRQQMNDPETKDRWQEPEVVQSEGPFRAQQQLRNLARGLAILHGRRRITDHELELVRRVAVGSILADRAAVASLFPEHSNGLTAKMCGEGIGKSEDRARQLLEELVLSKVLTTTKAESSGGKPATVYVPVPAFRDLLTRPLTALDHTVDLAGDFTDTTNTPEREGISGQSYQESQTGGAA